MKITSKSKLTTEVSSIRRSSNNETIGFENYYHLECFDSAGNLKWTEDFSNLVTDVGLNDNLDKYLKGSTYTAAWFVGLTNGSPTVNAADTMVTHAGWTEVVAYSEATRQALVLGAVASQSVSNTATKATYSINVNATTVGGCFIVSNSTKSGTTGVLYGVGAFTGGNKTVDDGDTLNVTVTLTASAL